MSNKEDAPVVIGTGIRVFAGDDDAVVMQFLDADLVVVAETRFSRELADVVLAHLMYVQDTAFGMHPKSGWIH